MKKVLEKKGVTLAELCVVMALLAILSTTVVSFCMIIKNYSDKLSIERETRESYALFNTALNTWIDYVDADGYTISVGKNDDGIEKLVAKKTNSSDNSETTCILYLKEEKLYASLPSGNQMELEMETFQKLSFELKSGTNGGLIEYTITHLKNGKGVTDTIVAVKAIRTARVKEGD